MHALNHTRGSKGNSANVCSMCVMRMPEVLLGMVEICAVLDATHQSF